ncbi:hypothetical protein DFH29DRAFT_612216 [Suillus ampliporus]|nr:hypothetical protein DFH29DRAFT_612216 [Suillus ampliporus]
MYVTSRWKAFIHCCLAFLQPPLSMNSILFKELRLSNWQRMQYYAKRVHSLRVDEEEVVIDKTILHALATSPFRTPNCSLISNGFGGQMIMQMLYHSYAP